MAKGGARPGAGRPKGSRSAATVAQQATISELAREHGEAALAALVQIATAGESEAARVSAANAILDRAYGKPTQTIAGPGPNGEHTVNTPADHANAVMAALARKHDAE